MARHRPDSLFIRRLRSASVSDVSTARGLQPSGPIINGMSSFVVQYPEQRESPLQPLQTPRPETLASFPDPDANLSCTATEARTEPEGATRPLNLERAVHQLGRARRTATELELVPLRSRMG